MFKPFANTRKAEQVVDEILATVRKGTLTPGARLPDENTMAQEFNVSRNCVREALRILETMGVVEVRHGRGCFLVDGTGLPEPPHWLKAFDADALDVLEVREAIEVKAAQLAATMGSPEEIADIERLAGEVAEMATMPDRDAEAFAHHVRAFHAAVARASHNSFLVRLAPGSWAARERQATFNVSGRLLLSARQHQEIAAAIATRDAVAAGRAMSRHLRDVIEQVRTAKPGDETGA